MGNDEDEVVVLMPNLPKPDYANELPRFVLRLYNVFHLYLLYTFIFYASNLNFLILNAFEDY